MIKVTKEQSKAIRKSRINSLIAMLDHMLPELKKLDKTSTYVLSMLILSLHTKLKEIEDDRDV